MPQPEVHGEIFRHATRVGNSDPDLLGATFPSLTRRTIIEGTLRLCVFAISSNGMPLCSSSQICLSSARDQYWPALPGFLSSRCCSVTRTASARFSAITAFVFLQKKYVFNRSRGFGGT